MATEGNCATLNFDFGREVPLDLQASVEKVKDADVVVFAGGISPGLEGEEMPVSVPGFKGGDRENIELPEVQTRLLSELKKAGKKIIFVNFSGSAMGLAREAGMCDAIIQAWYPGQAGGDAVASVLLGDYMDYSMKGRTYRYMDEAPLYPFGYGLSYTAFEYGEAKASALDVKEGEICTLTVPVTNVGERDGEEVVQVYLRRPGDKEGPSHALRAFKRVAIKKGETRQVTFQLDDESFEWFDENTNTVHPLFGEYEILYGGSSDRKQLKAVKVKRI